jgi:hypothetical protein
MALVALAAALWLAATFSSERKEQFAANVAFADGPSPATLDRGIRQDRRARAWQPDAGPKLLEWRLELRRGHRRVAEALLKQVVASEPANAEAWFYLARSAQDPRAAKAALRRFKALRRS